MGQTVNVACEFNSKALHSCWKKIMITIRNIKVNKVLNLREIILIETFIYCITEVAVV